MSVIYRIFNKSNLSLYIDDIKIEPRDNKTIKNVKDINKLNFLESGGSIFVLKSYEEDSYKDSDINTNDKKEIINKKPNLNKTKKSNSNTINNIKASNNKKLDNINLGDEN